MNAPSPPRLFSDTFDLGGGQFGSFYCITKWSSFCCQLLVSTERGSATPVPLPVEDLWCSDFSPTTFKGKTLWSTDASDDEEFQLLFGCGGPRKITCPQRKATVAGKGVPVITDPPFKYIPGGPQEDEADKMELSLDNLSDDNDMSNFEL